MQDEAAIEKDEKAELEPGKPAAVEKTNDGKSSAEIAKDILAMSARIDEEMKMPPDAEKKEEKADPPAKAEPEKKPEPAAKKDDEDDGEDTPIEKRNNAWYAKQRKKLQAEREARIKAEVELEVMRKNAGTQQQQQAAQKTERTAANVDDVFKFFVKAANGEFKGDPARALSAQEHNEEVLKATRTAIVNVFEEDEILAVIEKAEANGYGPQSEDILAVARDALPRVMARDHKAQRQNNAQSEQSQRAEQEKINELRQVMEKYPEFKDEKSPEFKHIEAWTKKYVGVLDGQGRIVTPGLLTPEAAAYVLAHPMIQAELVKADYRASNYDKLHEEHQRTKQKLDNMRQPESTGGPSRPAEDTRSGSAAVLAEIEEKFGALR